MVWGMIFFLMVFVVFAVPKVCTGKEDPISSVSPEILHFLICGYTSPNRLVGGMIAKAQEEGLMSPDYRVSAIPTDDFTREMASLLGDNSLKDTNFSDGERDRFLQGIYERILSQGTREGILSSTLFSPRGIALLFLGLASMIVGFIFIAGKQLIGGILLLASVFLFYRGLKELGAFPPRGREIYEDLQSRLQEKDDPFLQYLCGTGFPEEYEPIDALVREKLIPKNLRLRR